MAMGKGGQFTLAWVAFWSQDWRYRDIYMYYIQYSVKIADLTIDGSRMRKEWPTFLHFHAVFRKNCQIVGWRLLSGWRFCGKSWIHHC